MHKISTLLLLLFFTGISGSQQSAIMAPQDACYARAFPVLLQAIATMGFYNKSNNSAVMHQQKNIPLIKKKIRRDYGEDGVALCEHVINAIQEIAPLTTYEYRVFPRQLHQLIIHHNAKIEQDEILRRACESQNKWKLVHDKKLSDAKKTVFKLVWADEDWNVSGLINLKKSLAKFEEMDKEAPYILEVLQAEAGFTAANHEKPIVATYGAASCIALGGYDETNHAAFIAHIQLPEEVKKCGYRLSDNLQHLMKKPLSKDCPMKLYLRGGRGFEDTYTAIEHWIKMQNFPSTIVSKNTSIDSLRIDSRTGVVGKYSPLSNPYSREITERDKLHCLNSVYAPQIRIITSNPKE